MFLIYYKNILSERSIFKLCFFVCGKRAKVALCKVCIERNVCKGSAGKRGYLRAYGAEHTLYLMKFSFRYCYVSAFSVIGDRELGGLCKRLFADINAFFVLFRLLGRNGLK